MDSEVDKFVKESGLLDDESYIRRGAILAQDRQAHKKTPKRVALREEKYEEHYLDLEMSKQHKDRFKQTWTLYALVILCSIGAAVQGWDESAVSGGLDPFKSVPLL